MDLKQLINALNQGLPFPGRKEDFATQQGYDAWLTREKKFLQGLMTIMVTSATFSLDSSSEQDVGSTNLLSSAGGIARRASETAKRNSIYGNSAVVDDVSLHHSPRIPTYPSFVESLYFYTK